MKTMQYSKKQDKLHSARNNFTPFSSLFISCQTRKGGLEPLFSHENQACPTSLSKHGSLRPAKRKSSIIGCILPENFTGLNEGPSVSAKTCDGAATISMVMQTNCKNFLQYASKEFTPYIRSQAVNI